MVALMEEHLAQLLERLEDRLDLIDKKIERVSHSRHKSLEWIGQVSEQIRSLDEFREEVRASFEPLIGKLDNIEERMRILRHATVDVSRRVEGLESAGRRRKSA